MALSDTRLRTMKPKARAFSESDGGGLFIQVSPTGAKSWGLRYWLNGKQERIGLGTYPTYPLADARSWRDACKALAERGLSPMRLKRGDPIPQDATPAARELAQAFVRDWCLKARQMIAAQERAAANTLEPFAWRWYAEVVEPNNSNPRNIKRVLDKDVIPAIGRQPLAEVTPDDVLAITDAIKARGADQMALQTRNVLKRLFAYVSSPAR